MLAIAVHISGLWMAFQKTLALIIVNNLIHYAVYTLVYCTDATFIFI